MTSTTVSARTDARAMQHQTIGAEWRRHWHSCIGRTPNTPIRAHTRRLWSSGTNVPFKCNHRSPIPHPDAVEAVDKEGQEDVKGFSSKTSFIISSIGCAVSSAMRSHNTTPPPQTPSAHHHERRSNTNTHLPSRCLCTRLRLAQATSGGSRASWLEQQRASTHYTHEHTHACTND